MVSAGQPKEGVLDIHSLHLMAPGLFFLNLNPSGEAQCCATLSHAAYSIFDTLLSPTTV